MSIGNESVYEIDVIKFNREFEGDVFDRIVKPVNIFEQRNPKRLGLLLFVSMSLPVTCEFLAAERISTSVTVHRPNILVFLYKQGIPFVFVIVLLLPLVFKAMSDQSRKKTEVFCTFVSFSPCEMLHLVLIYGIL